MFCIRLAVRGQAHAGWRHCTFASFLDLDKSSDQKGRKLESSDKGGIEGTQEHKQTQFDRISDTGHHAGFRRKRSGDKYNQTHSERQRVLDGFYGGHRSRRNRIEDNPEGNFSQYENDLGRTEDSASFSDDDFQEKYIKFGDKSNWRRNRRSESYNTKRAPGPLRPDLTWSSPDQPKSKRQRKKEKLGFIQSERDCAGDDLLYGLHPVMLALSAGRRTVRRVLHRPDVPETGRVRRLLQLCQQMGVQTEPLPLPQLDAIAQGTGVHQGVCAEVTRLTPEPYQQLFHTLGLPTEMPGESEEQSAGSTGEQQSDATSESGDVNRGRIQLPEDLWSAPDARRDMWTSGSETNARTAVNALSDPQSDDTKADGRNTLDVSNLRDGEGPPVTDPTCSKSEDQPDQSTPNLVSGRESSSLPHERLPSSEGTRISLSHDDPPRPLPGESAQTQTHDVVLPSSQRTAEVGRKRRRIWLMLDRIHDPMNMGSILRTSYFLGVEHILVPERNSCRLSPTVSKASAGVLEVFPVHSVPAEVYDRLLTCLRERGWQLLAAGVGTDQPHLSPRQMDPTADTLLIVGNEGRGVDKRLVEHCTTVTVPPQRHLADGVESLNVAVATGILLSQLISGHKVMSGQDDVVS